MRWIAILLILLIFLPFSEQKSDAQDDSNPIETTDQPTATGNASNGESGAETPSAGNLDAPQVSPTAWPTDLPQITDTPPLEIIDTLPSTDSILPTETAPPDFGTTASPSDVTPSITSSSTPQFVETQPSELTETATVSESFTATDTGIADATVTAQPTVMSFVCKLDVDADGTITDSDLSQIGRELLNSAVNETSSIYDLNVNHQIDIGDLQKMAAYLFTTCSN